MLDEGTYFISLLNYFKKKCSFEAKEKTLDPKNIIYDQINMW